MTLRNINIMRTKYFLLLFLLLLGAGCATSQYGSEATAVLEEGEPSIADTTFLYDSRVIALETKDDALIARVNRLIEWKGNLYICLLYTSPSPRDTR